ncbi:hypothetical protein BJX61DRAFT_551498 [Aspergillus egyptiacus]|nr:hypothetical protein BJX61DRAFT_551498 [Aspergillus egyptiacus]
MSGMHPDVFISLFVSFLAIAAYNALELLIWIFNFFRRRRGLYFWSILTGTVSVAGFMVITTISYFVKTPTAASATGVAVALVYPCLLTAQILVLYSRLHLITPTQGPLLLVVRWGIIISSVLLLIPFTVNLTGLSTTTSKTQQRFLAAERVIEHYTIIGTLSRELLICAIYLFQALRQLKPILAVKGAAGRRVIIHLILAMGAVIVLDSFMLLTTFGGASGLGLAYSCVAHSIKLKVEFGILNRLLELLGAPNTTQKISLWSLIQPGTTNKNQPDPVPCKPSLIWSCNACYTASS